MMMGILGGSEDEMVGREGGGRGPVRRWTTCGWSCEKREIIDSVCVCVFLYVPVKFYIVIHTGTCVSLCVCGSDI